MRATFPILMTAGLGAIGLLVWLGVHQSPTPAAESAPVPPPAVPVAHHPGRPAAALPVEPAMAETPPPAEKGTNLLARLLKGEEVPKLTAEQIEPFLAANHRSAASLLAAGRTTGDPKYLQEAMDRFPNDPRVDFAAVFRNGAPPEERRHWLETFQKSDPNNALPTYLLALDDFKAGNRAAGLQQMAAAGPNARWTDYSADFMQNAEEAYASAGYSPTEAKLIGAENLLLPHLAGLKQLGVSLGETAKSSLQEGDAASAQAALAMEASLGHQLAAPQQQTLIATLVGIAVERMGLSAMDPAATLGDNGQTAQDRLAALTQQRAELKALTQQATAIQPNLSEPELGVYFDRMKSLGEVPAMQWLINRYGTK